MQTDTTFQDHQGSRDEKQERFFLPGHQFWCGWGTILQDVIYASIHHLIFDVKCHRQNMQAWNQRGK